MKWFDGFNKTEWRVLNISIVLMMLCAFILSNDRVLGKIGGVWSSGRRLSSPMGEITEAKGDTRIKLESAKEWRKATGTVYLGDNIFSGEDGSIHIRIKPGVEVRLSSTGIMRFALIGGFPCVDMLMGQFHWLITGEQCVAIQGARGILSGQQATVDVRVDSGATEPKIKVTSGQGGLQLNKNFSGPDELQAPVSAVTPNSVYFYVWRMDDFYQVVDQRVTARDKVPLAVPIEIVLNWEHPVAPGPFTVQTAGSHDFTKERSFYSTTDLSFTLDKALLGENFWRVSFNNLAWSEVRSFKVEPRFIEVKLQPLRKDPFIRLKSVSQVLIKWMVSEPMAGFVVEVSDDERFSPGRVASRWLSAPELVLEAEKPGIQFARIRALNSRQEISDWSPVVKIAAE